MITLDFVPYYAGRRMTHDFNWNNTFMFDSRKKISLYSNFKSQIVCAI